MTWNQKNLDYEIETYKIKSVCFKIFYTWNQKNLDYEIETEEYHQHPEYPQRLEIKRTSITRLKQKLVRHRVRRKSPWNQKNLDYEIETGC